ncbi:hypothetical protein PACTADRAFT_75661 [Pachysolen tannophilus NRRL Y-2460]|uniref:Uncharacterized protein n=1 Tax=Pachysolen tannophilus NRRL Y-2460 TaxID=669874 RepID=A0A1E4TTS8_PACTA|nr:hypothetical protein PACTADRAFT_75661 [Pachysolen tannophilus NRRL Y-2460]
MVVFKRGIVIVNKAKASKVKQPVLFHSEIKLPNIELIGGGQVLKANAGVKSNVRHEHQDGFDPINLKYMKERKEGKLVEVPKVNETGKVNIEECLNKIKNLKIITISPSYLNKSILIGDNIPIVSIQNDLKGVVQALFQEYFTQKLYIYTPVFHRCKWFSFIYAPSNHYLSLIRKSKPALIINFSSGFEFNLYKNKKKIKDGNSKNLNPLGYSFYRHYWQKKINELFFKYYSNNIEIFKDGTYFYTIECLPNNLKEFLDFQQNFDKSMEIVQISYLNKKPLNLINQKLFDRIKIPNNTWVMKSNSKIDWRRIKNICLNNNLPIIERPK